MAAWLKIAARSLAVATLAGAAQVGAAQALAILAWSAVPTHDVWRRELTWLVFMFAASVLAGVAGGRRSVRTVRLAIANRRAEAAAARHGGLVPHQPGLRGSRRRAMASAKYRAVDTARGIAAVGSRIGATVFASFGALLPVLLVLLPARNALAPADLRVLALAAVVGTAVGAVVSLLALLAAPIAANAGVWVAGVWIFGLASAGIALATGRPLSAPRLAILDAPGVIGSDDWWLGPNLMIAVAAFFGFAVAATARWVGAHRLAIAMSGLAGPAIVSAGYLLVGPGGDLTSGYVAALVAATVGLLTSTATAVAQRGKQTGPAVAPAALAAAAARAPMAIGSGATAPASSGQPSYSQSAYPPQKPASQYLAATVSAAPAPQYSANAYPTNQYPSMPGWPQPTPAPTASTPVYVAPPRSAPVTPPPVAPPTPVPRVQPQASPAPPTPAPAPAAPAPMPAPFTGPPGKPPTPPPRPAPEAKPAPEGKPAPEARPAPEAKPAPRTKAAPAKAARTKASGPAKAAAATATPAPAPGQATAATAEPAEASTIATPAAPTKGKAKHRGRADRTVRVPPPVQPEPVRSAPAATGDGLPRTARPAQVVAVEASKPSPSAEPAAPTGRRAKRRAARLAAERAEEEARLARQRERDAKTMGRREREHVEWLQRLSALPDDPTLTTRKK